MIVHGHRGDVEERRILSGVGVFLGEFDGREVIVDGAFGGFVELIAEVGHILGPVQLYAVLGHEVGYAEAVEVSGNGREFGDGVFEPTLTARDGGELHRVRIVLHEFGMLCLPHTRGFAKACRKACGLADGRNIIAK